MYPVLVIALSVMLALLMDGVAFEHRDLAKKYQSRVRSMNIKALAENIAQYSLENSTPPSDVSLLAGSAGFEHSRGSFDNWQHYAVSPTLNDGVWQFSRSVLFSVSPIDGTTPASYLASNACGTGSFDTAISWCGGKNSSWFRSESRELFNDQLATQRARMARTLQKFSDHYNAKGIFPNKDQLGTAFATNSVTTLAALVGYGGDALSCSGTFNYSGVPIDCGDLFSQWGQPIGYQFLSNKHVLLTSETPILNADTKPVAVGVGYDFSLL